jgi:hypothetical protein
MTTDGHLFVAFTPEAIQQHYECYYIPDSKHGFASEARKQVYEFVMNADTDTLRQIGESAINDEALWHAFDNVLAAAVEEIMNDTSRDNTHRALGRV